jgi:hypothetical protein
MSSQSTATPPVGVADNLLLFLEQPVGAASRAPEEHSVSVYQQASNAWQEQEIEVNTPKRQALQAAVAEEVRTAGHPGHARWVKHLSDRRGEIAHQARTKTGRHSSSFGAGNQTGTHLTRKLLTIDRALAAARLPWGQGT